MNKQPVIQQVLEGMQNISWPPCTYWLAQPPIEFPESEVAQSIISRNDESVWLHTMSVIDNLVIKNPITLLSGLFHDLGKGYINGRDDPKSPRFPNHAIESAKIAETRLRLWGASEYLIDRVCRIVETHMYDITNATKEKTIRQFIARVGQDNIDNWFTLRVADSQSYSAHKSYAYDIIEPFRKAVMLYLHQQPGTNQPEFSSSVSSGAIQGKERDA